MRLKEGNGKDAVPISVPFGTFFSNASLLQNEQKPARSASAGKTRSLHAACWRSVSLVDNSSATQTQVQHDWRLMKDEKRLEPSTGGNRKIKLLALALIALIAGLLLWQYGDLLSLENLASRESQLRAFQAENPILIYGIAFAVYVIVTGLSLPGAAALTLVFGWYFGFVRGVTLVSFASTMGATLAFLMTRYLLRDSIQSKFGDRLQTFNHHLEREGAFYLFTLRLIPAVPFFVINLVMGLTPLKARTFWWVSQLGMLPGTAVYVFAGSRVPNLNVLAEAGASAVFSPSQLLQLFIAFALLGLFPLVIKLVLKHFIHRKPETAHHE